MSCKSALYGVNTYEQNLTVGDVINFGQIVRRFGCHTNLNSGNVVLKGVGYYSFDSIFQFTGTGTATITFYKDGVAIPGAKASVVMATDTSVSIPFMVRETCDCESTITAVITGADATMTNAAIKVVKL